MNLHSKLYVLEDSMEEAVFIINDTFLNIKVKSFRAYYVGQSSHPLLF